MSHNTDDNNRMLTTRAPLVSFGEHEVDTVIHTIFSKFSSTQVFEGLCNPPGGDWSGLSLLDMTHAYELRWLSLPRVSGGDSKRPDHVVQFCCSEAIDIVMPIESKAKSGDIENDIGPRLTKYVRDLISYPANIQREHESGDCWVSPTTNLRSKDIRLVSATASLIDPDKYRGKAIKRLSTLLDRTRADLHIGLQLPSYDDACTVHLFPSTVSGKGVAELIESLRLQETPSMFNGVIHHDGLIRN